ncbi:MAG: hypothetical protein Q8Q85_05270 [Gemmatimonadales bacterium]|nr:hypothetical protein [Gemmatimonadales bacterium]
MYQLEVKRALVQLCFHPANGWAVTVDVDPMERAKGGKHHPDKAGRAAEALAGLQRLGAVLGKHALFGSVDVVAEHVRLGTRLIEVEADSSRQREQAMYSAVGQLLLSMKLESPRVRYGLAVPDAPEWIRQLRKIPAALSRKLVLDLYAVGDKHVQMFEAGSAIPDWSR